MHLGACNDMSYAFMSLLLIVGELVVGTELDICGEQRVAKLKWGDSFCPVGY